MTFQFGLWDKFKELPSLSSSVFSNLVQLVTRFLLRKSLSLSILKVRRSPPPPHHRSATLSGVTSPDLSVHILSRSSSCALPVQEWTSPRPSPYLYM